MSGTAAAWQSAVEGYSTRHNRSIHTHFTAGCEAQGKGLSTVATASARREQHRFPKSNFSGMNVKRLKQELTQRSLPTDGRKLN